jgi:hypothetical protein
VIGLAVAVGWLGGWTWHAVRHGRETACGAFRRLARTHPDVGAALLGGYVALGIHLFREVAKS